MKKFYITMTCFLLVIITGIALAQDKPEAKPEPKQPELPAKVELTAEDTKTLQDGQKDAQLVALQVENLQLKIQQAQDELKKLQEAQQEKQRTFAGIVTRLTKIPVEKLQEYSVEEKNGKLVFTKK